MSMARPCEGAFLQVQAESQAAVGAYCAHALAVERQTLSLHFSGSVPHPDTNRIRLDFVLRFKMEVTPSSVLAVF